MSKSNWDDNEKMNGQFSDTVSYRIGITAYRFHWDYPLAWESTNSKKCLSFLITLWNEQKFVSFSLIYRLPGKKPILHFRVAKFIKMYLIIDNWIRKKINFNFSSIKPGFYFAGEAFDFVHAGYVTAAYKTGISAALDIASKINK